jgi:hypothetical protein
LARLECSNNISNCSYLEIICHASPIQAYLFFGEVESRLHLSLSFFPI